MLQAGGRSAARHPGESAEDSPSDEDSGARDTCGIGLESAVAHTLATLILSFLTARRASGRPLTGTGGLGNREAPPSRRPRASGESSAVTVARVMGGTGATFTGGGADGRVQGQGKKVF